MMPPGPRHGLVVREEEERNGIKKGATESNTLFLNNCWLARSFQL